MLRMTTLAAAAVCAMLAVSSAPASAQLVCSKGPAAASGRPSLTAITARLSARRAWRGSVAATKGLGPRFAQFRRARKVSYACRAAGRRTVCRVTAVPCRPR